MSKKKIANAIANIRVADNLAPDHEEEEHEEKRMEKT